MAVIVKKEEEEEEEALDLLLHIIYPALTKALLGAKADQLIGCVTSRMVPRLQALSFSIRGTVVIFLPSCADFVFLSS